MIKQVIVIRKDLRNVAGGKVRTGKIIAQACHASISFLTKKIQFNEKGEVALDWDQLTEAELSWIKGSFTKVCLSVNNDDELLKIKSSAEDAGLNCNLITDSGLTEFGGVPTNTCLSIGPDFSEKIDKITGDLELY